MAIAEFIDPYIDEDMNDYPSNAKSTDWLRLVTLHRTRLKSCDMQRHLYLMYNEKDNVVYNMTAHACERPFVVLPIPNSNMILLVIDQRCPRDTSIQLTVNPGPIPYPLDKNQTFACYKNDREFSRVRPVSCINRHINVSTKLYIINQQQKKLLLFICYLIRKVQLNCAVMQEASKLT